MLDAFLFFDMYKKLWEILVVCGWGSCPLSLTHWALAMSKERRPMGGVCVVQLTLQCDVWLQTHALRWDGWSPVDTLISNETSAGTGTIGKIKRRRRRREKKLKQTKTQCTLEWTFIPSDPLIALSNSLALPRTWGHRLARSISAAAATRCRHRHGKWKCLLRRWIDTRQPHAPVTVISANHSRIKAATRAVIFPPGTHEACLYISVTERERGRERGRKIRKRERKERAQRKKRCIWS